MTMKWSKEAEKVVNRAPFFVRKRIRSKVEEEAVRCDAPIVTIEHVMASKRKFTEGMEREIRGYRVEQCFGPSGCPNRAVADENLADAIEKTLDEFGLLVFLKEKNDGPLKFHHEFRVTIADCPNACSRPQISDFAVIGAAKPACSEDVECAQCGLGEAVCQENAIQIPEGAVHPEIDYSRCLLCGQCILNCPTKHLVACETGYRIQLGGRLGRHPRLAEELGGIYPRQQVIEILKTCVRHFMDNYRPGDRFGDIMTRTGMDFLRSGRS